MVATQACATRRKPRWSRPPPRPSAGAHAQPYRRRRPEATTLHRIVREHLETYLALANQSDAMGDGVPDHVIPHVPVRQFVLSVPKRLRPFLHHRPRTASAVLHILLRALPATLREACPTAPASASMGAVSFLHRFGSSLNPHFHYHVCVVDGLFEKIEGETDQGPAHPETRVRFHEATGCADTVFT